MREASLADVDLLVDMMTEFYAEADYSLNVERAAEAFRTLLADDRLEPPRSSTSGSSAPPAVSGPCTLRSTSPTRWRSAGTGRWGFVSTDRQRLTLRLAPPTHAD